MARNKIEEVAIKVAASALILSATAFHAFAQQPVVPEKTPEKPIGILLAVGDIGNCDSDMDEKVAELVWNTMQDARLQDVPVRLVTLGDHAYEAGTAWEFKKCFDPQWGMFKPIMLPVPGNHEYVAKLYGQEFKRNEERGPIALGLAPAIPPGVTEDDMEHAKPYFEYFKTEPKNNAGKPLVESMGPLTGYYAIRFPKQTKGSWLLIGLNTYTRAEVEPEWEDWLKSTLMKNRRKRGDDRARCILAFAHIFRYSTGLHGHGYVENNSNARLVDYKYFKRAYKVLRRYRTSVLLSGHDHHFEQFPRMNNRWRKSKRGIRQFVVGTGGAELYLDVIKRDYNTVYKQMSRHTEHLIGDKYGIMKIELFPDRYSWAFLPVGGPPIIPKIHQDFCRTK